ncbi:Cyk3p ASCRUDRAFT_19293, partial [Ascoidea rubescens DSM 1968]
YIQARVNLNRSSSITAKEKRDRIKRINDLHEFLILEPHKLITKANVNEVVRSGRYSTYSADKELPPLPMSKNDYSSFSSSKFKLIDSYIRNLKSQYLSPKSFITNDIGLRYSTTLDRIRAIYIFCTEKIELVDTPIQQPKMDVRYQPSNLTQVFKNRQANKYELTWLFKFFLDQLGIKNELILGFLKDPFCDNKEMIANHIWNSILIDFKDTNQEEWRFVDCFLSNLANPLRNCLIEKPVNLDVNRSTDTSIYFLMKPLEIIHTHIPLLIEQQHIAPPIDSELAISLPVCLSSFFKNKLKLYKFNVSLTKMLDLEIFEMELEIPKHIEVFASLNTFSLNTDNKNKDGRQYTICQVYWKNNFKFCKIKAVLPLKTSSAILEIRSGFKGEQKTLEDIHPLSLTVPLFHEGKEKQLKFVTRCPTIHCQNHDLYIKEPQIKHLTYNSVYIFKVYQFLANGINSNKEYSKAKLALQTPNGRIIELRNKDPVKPYGSWEASTQISERGTWKGLVVTDGGVAWCVFAEW